VLPWAEYQTPSAWKREHPRREAKADGLEREGIHWPSLAEEISLENLLLGKASGESQDSLRRWLDGRAIV